MKLSEAILLGSIGSEQGFGSESIFYDSPTKCALGAALLAIGVKACRGDRVYDQLIGIWPWVNGRVSFLSSFGFAIYKCEGYKIIWRLNDIQKWSRPQIAAWVATIEPKEVEQPQETTTLVEAA